MEDSRIIQMFWDRDPEAIEAATEKYTVYCGSIAANILSSREDVQECLNDAWHSAWGAIPPQRPDDLKAFLGKITRNLAFNRYRYNHAGKRNEQMTQVLDELSQCAPGDPEQELERRELAQALDEFLAALPEKKRSLLLCRYWFGDSVGTIAKNFHMTQGAVTMQLKRLREQLRRYLTERGIGV